MTSLGRRAHLAVRVLIYIGRRQRDNERAQGASGRNVGRRCRGWAQTGISPSRVCEKLRTGLPDPDSDVLVLPARTSLIVAMHARASLVCQGSDRLRADAFTRRSGLRAVARSLLLYMRSHGRSPDPWQDLSEALALARRRLQPTRLHER